MSDEDEELQRKPLCVGEIEWIKQTAAQFHGSLNWQHVIRLCDAALGNVPIDPERPAIGSAWRPD